jgi:hypothetical protein
MEAISVAGIELQSSHRKVWPDDFWAKVSIHIQLGEEA